MNKFQLNRSKPSTLVSASYALLLLGLLLFAGSVYAATDIEDITAEGEITVAPIEPLTAEELGDLVAPIALYPDDLLAIVLPAATYPIQIVQAARFLEARKNDPTLEPDEDWDDSIIALLNYPEIIALLNGDLDWTWQLGEAVLVQEADLIAAVSNFRERARIAGNLESDDRQIVAVDDEGAIKIRPADPEVIYVPYYEPERVTVYQRYPVYHYYPQGYPLYYYPYPRDYVFSTGYFWGVTSAFSIGWSSHRLHLHHYGYDSHPYYSYSYYDPFYNRRPHLWLSYDYSGYYNHHRNRHHDNTYHDDRHHEGNRWQPDPGRAGARPHNPDRHDRDWRNERGSDRIPSNRRREMVVAERRSRTAEQRQTSQRDRTRVVARANENRTAAVVRRANRAGIERRTALATVSSGKSVDRRTQPEVRSQPRERVARIERKTSAPVRRVDSRRRTDVVVAKVRAPGKVRSRPQRTSLAQTRSQPAAVHAPVVRQARVATAVRAPVKVQRTRESRSNSHAPQRRSSGIQRSNRGGARRHDH